jgi:hypothetical protein
LFHRFYTVFQASELKMLPLEEGLQTDEHARHFLRSNRRFFNRKENAKSLLLEYVENSY